MDKGFQKHEAKRVAGLREQEQSDFTAEMNGTDNGRMKRFGIDAKQQQDKIRKEREKQSLAHALKISAVYAKLYNSTMQDLHDATSAVYEAQLLASMELEKAQGLLRQTLDEASFIPDGTAVFRSKDGTVYDQNGQKLGEDTLLSVLWREDAPSWEAYQDRNNAVESKQERLDLMNTHSVRLDELQARMEDEGKPPSMEEMQAVQAEVKDILDDARKGQSLHVELSIQKTAPAALPDLKF